jgi:hypothetical protein
MAKISVYPEATPPALDDFIIGTDVSNSNATKNFVIADVLALGGVGASSVVKTVKVTFTPTEILNIFTTPKVLVAASPGKLFIPMYLYQNYIFVTNFYSSQSWRIAWDADQTNGFVTVSTPLGNSANTEAITTLIPSIASTSGITHVGKSLTVSTPSVNPTDGDSTLDFYLVYTEITIQ